MQKAFLFEPKLKTGQIWLRAGGSEGRMAQGRLNPAQIPLGQQGLRVNRVELMVPPQGSAIATP